MRWLLATVAIPLLSSAALAQELPLEERVEDLARRFEYVRAAALIEDFLSGQAQVEGELRAREMLVTMYASAGDLVAARRAATVLFRRDPGYPVPAEGSLPPRIRAVFSEARSGAGGAPEPLAVSLRSRGDRLELTGTVPPGPGLVDRALIGLDDGAGFVAHEAVPAEGRFELSAPRRRAAPVRYHVRLVTPHGFVLARAGTASSPLAWRDPAILDVADQGDDDPDSSLAWWLVGGGVLAAGLVIGLILLLPPSAADPTISDGIVVP